MGKFIVNASVFGYNNVDISSDDILNSNDSDIVIVVKDRVAEKSKEYYSVVKKIAHKNKIYLITDNAELPMFKSLASYLISVDCYNIYTVKSINIIDTKYINSIINRKPDFTEVQSYISGEIVAYSDISNIVLSLEDAVKSGNADEVKEIIESKIGAISDISTALNRLKKLADISNSDELIERINSLKEDIRDKEEELIDKDKQYAKLKNEKEDVDVKLSKATKELEEVSNQLKQANEIDKNTDVVNVIKSYDEIKTSLIHGTTKNILYVKEVSYVPYTNSFIMALMSALKMKKKKAITVIFDSANQFYQIYGGTSATTGTAIPTVSGKRYISSREQFIHPDMVFVMTETVQSVIKDILISQEAFDLVIVYDRLKCPTDMISGNNVTKMFVCNSTGDYLKVKDTLKITEQSLILTRENCDIPRDNAIAISTIPNYRSLTNSAKIQNYCKLVNAIKSGSNEDARLINIVLKKARVE